MSTVFEDRQSTYPNRCRITPLDGTPYYAVIERADEPIVVGTPLNAETLNGMVDEIAARFHTESVDHPGCYYRMVDGDVEWINPPMLTGTEYRTTERSERKVVYTKRLVVDLPSPGGYNSVEITSSDGQPYVVDIRCSIIDAEGTYIYHAPFDHFDGGTPVEMLRFRVSVVIPTPGITTVQLDYRVLRDPIIKGKATFDIKYTK